ncbi:MAG: lipoate--protein ligase [Eubacteriales bacterium]|nr:lipoate--protein ligase [Eubacteriales bacterium]
MLYLRSTSHNAAYNIAFEEFVFRHLAPKEDCFILWHNNPVIVVGKNQNTLEEINEEYCREQGIRICRRLSGGGAVYQDINCLDYTITSREGRRGAFDFAKLSEPVIDCLKSLGVEASFTGRNDLQIDGAKFCGNAQLVAGDLIMHHGCMLFDTDLDVLAKALKVKALKLQSKGRKSVRSRVTNIKAHMADQSFTVEDFIDALYTYMKKHFDVKEYQLSPEEEAQVRAYQAMRNDNPDWVYGKNPPFTLSNQAYLPGGLVEARVLVEHNKIEAIHFYGDFFGRKDVSELEATLHGVEFSGEAILACLESVGLSDYFLGITAQELCDLITGATS